MGITQYIRSMRLKRAMELLNTKDMPVYRIAEELQDKIDNEIRVCVPGHFQRGGSPCPYDRVLSTRFGAAAAKLIVQKQYGNMVALQNGQIVPVPLSEVAGKLKTVPKDCDVVQTGRDIGINFGD